MPSQSAAVHPVTPESIPWLKGIPLRLRKYYYTLSFYSYQPLVFSLYLLHQLILPVRTQHLNCIKVIIAFEIKWLMERTLQILQQRTSDSDRSLWRCQKHWRPFKIYLKIQDVNSQHITHFTKSSNMAWVKKKVTTGVLFDMGQNTIKLMMIDANV